MQSCQKVNLEIWNYHDSSSDFNLIYDHINFCMQEGNMNSEVKLPVYSSPPCAAYMHQRIWSALVQIMPIRHQAITWTKPGLLSIGRLRTNFSEIWMGILSFSFKKMHLKMLSAKMAAILSRGRWVKQQSVTGCCYVLPVISCPLWLEPMWGHP